MLVIAACTCGSTLGHDRELSSGEWPASKGDGYEIEGSGRKFLEGEFLDTVIGIPGSRTEIVMLRPPDGGAARAGELHPA
jgi:hypothetical protein